MSPLVALPVDLLLLAGLSGFGFLLARAILPDRPWVECLALSFPLGAGMLTWLVFIASLAGLSVSLPTVLGIWLVATLSVGAFLKLRKTSIRGASITSASREAPLTGLSIAGLAGSLILFGLSLFLTVGRAQAGWDAMAIWSVKGYGIALEGSILAGRHWGELGLSYPLNIPLLISFFALLDGDVLPGSKLVFPLFYGSLLFGCYLFWRGQGVTRLVSSLGLLILASVPIIYDHATLGYANLPEACYLVLGCLYATSGILNGSRESQLMGGLLLGLGVWTRLEGVLLVLTTVIALAVTVRLIGKATLWLAGWLLPMVVLSGIWLAFAREYASSSLFIGLVGRAGGKLLEGAFNLSAIREIAAYTAKQAVDPYVWGLMTPIVFALVWIGRKRLTPKTGPVALSLLVVGLSTGAAVLVFYYLASFGGPPLDWWLSTGLDRTALPSVLLLAVAAVLAAGAAQAGEMDA